MKTVQQILAKKGNGIFTIAPNATMYDALKLMADSDVGALLVLEDEKVAGILSERDYARKVILKGKLSKETLVSEIMTEDVVKVTPSTLVEECMAVMTAKHIRHLPVEENGKLLGLVSIGDVVSAVIDEEEFVIEQLTSYIKGSR
ncbi:MAG: CBS domain-containing protein [Ignavibacteria bacterium]|nr:CBS domain-containing protein [Ignavibacteria bacterium]